MKSYGFQAVIGLVGVETADGRTLAMPQAPEERTWVAETPLPLYGTMLDRREKIMAGTIGHVRGIRLYDHVLWAEGEFDDSQQARDYAGACRLGAAHMTVDITANTNELPTTSPLGPPRWELTDWQVRSVSVVRWPGWELPEVEVSEPQQPHGAGRHQRRKASNEATTKQQQQPESMLCHPAGQQAG